MVANQFKMPDVGEGLTEADILAWHVKVGDTVGINDVIVEVETAKAAVELPSPFAGVVTAILHPVGQTVDVGSAIIEISDDVPAVAVAEVLPQVQPAAVGVAEAEVVAEAPAPHLHEEPTGHIAADLPEAEPEERHQVLVGYGPTKAKVARRSRVKSALPVALVAVGDRSTPSLRPNATPPVRKLARELGVDLRSVNGSGDRGQITRADLHNAGPQGTARAFAPQESIPPESREIRTPIKGVRKYTAEAMVASAFTAPHVTEWVAVDMTRTIKLVERLRADRYFAGVRLSPLVLVAKATLLALTRHSAANSKWDGAANEIVEYKDVNLGIAAATPRGLLVPNIKAAQAMSTKELANSLTALITEAREGKTPPERMKGGTFTITNIGVFGIDGGTPILNPGEAAILCFGQARRQPWEHNGKVKLRSVATLALSFDHRLIDGELGSKLLADIAGLLERPSEALSW